jgi:hypothetical protein
MTRTQSPEQANDALRTHTGSIELVQEGKRGTNGDRSGTDVSGRVRIGWTDLASPEPALPPAGITVSYHERTPPNEGQRGTRPRVLARGLCELVNLVSGQSRIVIV